MHVALQIVGFTQNGHVRTTHVACILTLECACDAVPRSRSSIVDVEKVQNNRAERCCIFKSLNDRYQLHVTCLHGETSFNFHEVILARGRNECIQSTFGMFSVQVFLLNFSCKFMCTIFNVIGGWLMYFTSAPCIDLQSMHYPICSYRKHVVVIEDLCGLRRICEYKQC